MKLNPADVAFANYIKTLAGYTCEYCGSSQGQMQAHHHQRRKKLITRYDEENIVCLCAGCHLDFHAHPNKDVAFFTQKLGSDHYEKLCIRSEQTAKGIGLKIDKKEMAKKYKNKLKEIE